MYVGANDGALHAFATESVGAYTRGQEVWAFVPPFIMSKLPLVINEGLNNTLAKVKGGSNAIYGVDGSPVVHDMYFKSPYDSSEKWHTILIVPFGRGGNGFTVLDVTNPDKPLHLYTVYNNHIKNKTSGTMNRTMFSGHGSALLEYFVFAKAGIEIDNK